MLFTGSRYKGLPFIHTLLLNVETPDAISSLVYNLLLEVTKPTKSEYLETYRSLNSKSIIFALPNTSKSVVGAELLIPTRPSPTLVSAKNNVPPAPTVNLLKISCSGKVISWEKLTLFRKVVSPEIWGTKTVPCIITSLRKVTFSLNCASLPVTDIFDILFS